MLWPCTCILSGWSGLTSHLTFFKTNKTGFCSPSSKLVSYPISTKAKCLFSLVISLLFIMFTHRNLLFDQDNIPQLMDHPLYALPDPCIKPYNSPQFSWNWPHVHEVTKPTARTLSRNIQEDYVSNGLSWVVESRLPAVPWDRSQMHEVTKPSTGAFTA